MSNGLAKVARTQPSQDDWRLYTTNAVVDNLGWWERLRVLFGADIRVDVQVTVDHRRNVHHTTVSRTVL